MSVLSEEKRVDEPQASSGNKIRDTAAQREANKTKLLLARIVESSDDAILSIRLDGIIVSWNRGAVHLFVYGQEEVIGHHISVVIPEELRRDKGSGGKQRHGVGVGAQVCRICWDENLAGVLQRPRMRLLFYLARTQKPHGEPQ